MRCGNCWKRGHSKRQCPDMSSIQKAYYADVAKNRACTHCKRNGYSDAIGHNKRGCSKYKRDRKAWVQDVIKYRKLVYEAYTNNGINYGTLVAIPIENWRKYGARKDLEVDVLLVQKMEMPDGLERPYFVLKSTITGNEEIYSLPIPNIVAIEFSSHEESFGNRKIYFGNNANIQALSAGFSGESLVKDMSEFDNEETIKFPKYME